MSTKTFDKYTEGGTNVKTLEPLSLLRKQYQERGYDRLRPRVLRHLSRTYLLTCFHSWFRRLRRERSMFNEDTRPKPFCQCITGSFWEESTNTEFTRVTLNGWEEMERTEEGTQRYKDKYLQWTRVEKPGLREEWRRERRSIPVLRNQVDFTEKSPPCRQATQCRGRSGDTFSDVVKEWRINRCGAVLSRIGSSKA